MGESTSANKKKIRRNPAPRTRRAMSKEKFNEMRNARSHDTKEVNVWGKFEGSSCEKAHEAMWDVWPHIQNFTIPRVVTERLDLSSNAKLIYGVLSQWPEGKALYREEIAGLVGLSIYTVGLALNDLAEAGLIKKTLRKKIGANRRPVNAPTHYLVIEPVNRFTEYELPSFLKSDLTSFEEVIKDKFGRIRNY